MNYTLVAFVVLYLLGTWPSGLGRHAHQEHGRLRHRRPQPAADHGRDDHLRHLVRAETVMGIPARFVQGGLNAWSKTRSAPAPA
jgi:hypothetical protein